MLGTDPPHPFSHIVGPYLHVFSYLLSPQTSLLGGLGSPTTRLVLVGFASPVVTPTFSKDPDFMILSEIVEFAYSLSTPQKGQEPFPGLPHLQPYRLIRAHQLAELGHVQLATRYERSITTQRKREAEPHLDTVTQSPPRLIGPPFIPLMHSTNHWGTFPLVSSPPRLGTSPVHGSVEV